MLKSCNSHIIPGHLEVFCGPMYSGKTQSLLARLDPLKHMNADFLFLKPDCDSRKSRAYGAECLYVDENSPSLIFDFVKPSHELIAIDEIQFFAKGISGVIEELLRSGKNVVAAGLDLNFRGEPFGCMPYVLPIANEIIKLKSAVCRYPSENGGICRKIATRTQRIINGMPADYNAPVISIEGEDARERYEPRCLEHHFVPNRPK